MNAKCRNSGITLTEMAVVVGAVAVLTVLGLPAIRAFLHSFESQGATRSMISASLASARATAAKEQRYAGIRFQSKYQPDGKGCQYMIFIIHDPEETDDAFGFRAVEGVNPIKLPDNVGVMEVVDSDEDIDNFVKLTDETTFSVVFSPSGKLVIHDVQVLNIGVWDDIFNTGLKVLNGLAMFIEDDEADQEPSKKGFVIYDKKVFENVDENDRYEDYLKNAETIYINPYTGTIINR